MDQEQVSENPSREIVLASSSVYRRQLLEQIGLKFHSVSPEVDESKIQNNSELSPREIAQTLARTKAQAVSEKYPKAIVIGSDQVVDFRGKVIGKPLTEEKNIEQLQQFSGRSHFLLTAVSIVVDEIEYGFLNETKMTVRSLNKSEISRYVKRDQAFDCAGGYRWESAGISLFEKIETEDHSAILGLPLIRTLSVLRSLGVSVP